MITLLGGAALIAALWWLSGALAGGDSERRALWLGRMVSAALAGAAILLALRGRLDMALLLGLAALWPRLAGIGGWPGLGRLKPDLHRRLAGRREHAERDAHARPVQPAPSMTEEQAYQVLGLAPGADEAAILGAHRRLVKRVHPDQGGSAELAARVNQARDVLLGQHRR